MDVERSSLCNCVVNFLIEENYLLTAFELLHELLDDGRDAQAIRLKEFFSDSSQFPPDQISRFNALRVADPQSLLEEKEALEEKFAFSEYELRLAQEDIAKFKAELQKKIENPSNESSEVKMYVSGGDRQQFQREKKVPSISDIGPLKDNERLDLNCAVKEYLLIAGYRLTAMTFYEEVTDQNLDVWENSPACVPDALRHYYYQYLSSTTEAAEEKIAMHRENESLLQANKTLNREKELLLKNKESADGQISALNKNLEIIQKEVKEKESLVQDLKKSIDMQRKELNDCRAEITSLKMQIEGSRAGLNLFDSDVDHAQPQSFNNYEEKIKLLQMELDSLKERDTFGRDSEDLINSKKDSMQTQEKVLEIPEDKLAICHPVEGSFAVVNNEDKGNQLLATKTLDDHTSTAEEISDKVLTTFLNSNSNSENNARNKQNGEPSGVLVSKLDKLLGEAGEAASPKMGFGTIQILADALPKIVPYVLINHREELLPLIMCAIERHPDSSIRDSLTHTLFNLIKRPDEQQRRIIMDACVTLSSNVGEMRTETELLPQCWEQINHLYEERRLLVAQSCGELAEYVRPEIRDSLILSIVQQLMEDSANVVRDAAVHNLALLLPLFPNMDKYFKVEEMMFQMVCDPSGVVVETTLKKLVPAVVKWGNKLDHILRVLLSHILSSVQHCPPLSGVDGSVESHLHVLGERDRWSVDVLLRMLLELLPSVQQKAIETSPPATQTGEVMFSTSLIELYAEGHVEWPAFEWMHVDCLPDLIHLTCLLPQKEDGLRNRITKFLLAVSEYFGDSYLTHIMLPLFLVAVGENADLRFFPPDLHSRVKALKPRTIIAERLATMCVLPLLLSGVLGAPSKREYLVEFLRKLLVEDTAKENQSTKHNNEIIDAIRFFCTFEEHQGAIFNVLWEMVVSANVDMKIRAANLLKVMVPYIDAKVASTSILPALVTLGSDQNLNVKYASIDAFGAVAQHFKNDMIVEKIRVQMDAFLEDGSHEAAIAVIHALVVAVPHTTERLRDYLLSKIFQLSTVPPSSSNVIRRRERADAFCEAVRALDATDLPANSIRDFFLPTIQNLLKDPDVLDPAHKEALEIILKERSGGTLETLSKVMGAHLGLASSVTSFFGEGGLRGKKESEPPSEPSVEPSLPVPAPLAEDTRLRRIMRGTFSDMLRGKAKSQEESQNH